MVSNAPHTVGDGDGGEASAVMERIPSNTRHAVGDGNGGKAGAACERPIYDTCHAIGEGNGGKAGAARERTAFNARHAVGDGDGSEASAARESTVSDALHWILHSLVSNFFGNNHISRIGIEFVIFVRHFGNFPINIIKVIIDAVNLGIVGECVGAHHAEEQGKQ